MADPKDVKATDDVELNDDVLEDVSGGMVDDNNNNNNNNQPTQPTQPTWPNNVA